MSGDWTGNLFDFFFRIYPKLVRDVKVPFRLEGIVRVDDTPVHKAIREALVNCLVNTDFYIPRGVVIRKDADTISWKIRVISAQEKIRCCGEASPIRAIRR